MKPVIYCNNKNIEHNFVEMNDISFLPYIGVFFSTQNMKFIIKINLKIKEYRLVLQDRIYHIYLPSILLIYILIIKTFIEKLFILSITKIII